MLKRCHPFLIALIMLGSAATMQSSAWAAAPPLLMVLERIDGDQRTQIPVEAKRGAFLSPTRGKEFDKWTLRPGSAFASEARPDDMLVEFYRGVDSEPVLLFSIGIRYFRDNSAVWVPHYQLNEEVRVVRDKNGRWQPLTAVRGAATFIVLTNTTLPNSEGFYPSLEFGLTNGLLQIDSWVVR